MAEYLSPGVYIEEFEMGAKPIEGVSTSTVGFVGVTEYPCEKLPEAKRLEDLKIEVAGDILTALEAVITKLKKAITEEEDEDHTAVTTAVDEMPVLVKTLKTGIDALPDTPVAKKVIRDKALAILAPINQLLEEAVKVSLCIKAYISFLDKPTFVSSWGDYVSKFGRYTENNYLAPAVYSFFANGGKRCYVVRVASASNGDILGTGSTVNDRKGLRSLEEIDEVSILCIPGVTDATVQLAMISHCENMGDRFAIFDPAVGETLDAIKSRKEGLVSDKGIGALYYPWIKTAVEQKNDEGKVTLEKMLIPPSGAVAGIYAKSDSERGVHKAPANEVVQGVTELERTITKADQDILNPLNINCIRAFQGRGIRVWGARTIAPTGSEWKYVNVRRLFLFLEESIDESTQWVVFEPNNEQLWARVAQTINNFLLGVWKSGALMGKSPDEAFFVKCDRTTMTQDDIDNGRLIVVIGVAPTKPAEFVIFRIAQWTGSSNS